MDTHEVWKAELNGLQRELPIDSVLLFTGHTVKDVRSPKHKTMLKGRRTKVRTNKRGKEELENFVL